MLKLPIPIEDFATRLLGWYQDNRRELPWRNKSTAYHIWISEVMLQQTQVKTVVQRFEEFLKTYPSLEHLANAEEGEVLSSWAGLGYYSRARNLHQTAKIVSKQYSGKFPSDYELALKLPGIGRYTAGAILSIAFGKAVPILDVNIHRLLVRYLKIREETPHLDNKALWELLRWMVQQPAASNNIGNFNQGLMELGSLICRSRNPQCSLCPLAQSCLAFQEGVQNTLPRAKKRPLLRHVHFTVALIEKNGKYLLGRNSATPSLKGFWEFPKVSGQPDQNTSEIFRRIHSLDLRVKKIISVPITHQITFRKLHFYPLLASIQSPLATKDFRWIRPYEDKYPIATHVKKIFKSVNC